MHSSHPIHRALVTFSNSTTGEIRVKIPALLGADSEVAISYIGRKAPWAVPTVGDQIVVTSDDTNLTNVFWLQTGSSTSTSSTSSPISGVTSNVAGTGISVSGSTGDVTIANTGVTSFTSSSGLSTNTSATGAVSVTNTGVTSLTGGTGVSLNTSTGAVTASIGQSVATTATPTFGNITASGSGDTSIKINSTSGYAIQYFSINGTNRWHYEVTPSYQSWALVESGVAQRMTVNAGTGDTTVTGRFSASGQPYFVVGGAWGGSGSSIVKVNFETTYNGSNYSHATSNYIVPVTGKYFFSTQVRIDLATAGGYMRLAIVRNNGTIYQAPNLHAIFGGAHSTDYHSMMVSGVMFCNANDVVSVYAGREGGNSSFQAESTFTGWFLG